MKASETSLRNLLEGGKQFQIPLFQRPYSWDEQNWKTLWEDLMELYNGEVEGSYFMGAIVTQAIPGTADGISPYIVIDGQQRLTTLTIILAALRFYLKKNEPQAADELYELYLINKFKRGDDIYKVLPTQSDRESYTSLISAKVEKDIKKDANKIYEAYKFFAKQIKNPDPEEDISLDTSRFKSVLLERLILVNITSDDQDNPYLIFESLNSKGQELTQADLVRNYIFMKLPCEQREEVHITTWLPLQKKFQDRMQPGKEYTEKLTEAFWFYLRKDGESVNEKEIYKSLKKSFDNAESIPGKIQEVVNFADYYYLLQFPDTEPEVKLQQAFKRLIRLDFTTCHIFLLNIYHDYANEKLSLKEFLEILRYLESYFVRRLFVNISPKSLGLVFNKLYGEVKQENPQDLVSGLRSVLKKYEKTKLWPDNEAFRNGILTGKIYSKSSSDRAKLILERIESSLTKESVDPANLSVEHIMPQTLNAIWKSHLGSTPTQVHKQWLDTLGNLTLTGYNSELSNKPFSEKKALYLNSNLSLNKYFQNIETWNEEQIKKRAEDLANKAIEIWPY